MIERRTFLKAVAALAAFAATAGSAVAAPLAVDRLDAKIKAPDEPQPATASDNDIAAARIEEVRWGRRRGWGFRRRGWGRRRWGWGRRRWRRRLFWRPHRRWRRRRVRYYW